MRLALALLLFALMLDLACVVWVADLSEPTGEVRAQAESRLFPVRPPTGVRALEVAAGPAPAAGRSAPAPDGECTGPAEQWRALGELAEALARLGHEDGALELLGAAVAAALDGSPDERIHFAAWIESNPSFADLRSDERFLDLLDRLIGPPVGRGLV